MVQGNPLKKTFNIQKDWLLSFKKPLYGDATKEKKPFNFQKLWHLTFNKPLHCTGDPLKKKALNFKKNLAFVF